MQTSRKRTFQAEETVSSQLLCAGVSIAGGLAITWIVDHSPTVQG